MNGNYETSDNSEAFSQQTTLPINTEVNASSSSKNHRQPRPFTVAKVHTPAQRFSNANRL